MRLAFLLGIPVVCACDPGSSSKQDSGATDSTSEDPSEGPATKGCGKETITVLDDLDVVPPTFDVTVASILAGAEGTYSGTIDWLPNDGPVTVAPAGSSSDLVLAAARGNREVRLIEVELAGSFPDGNEGGWLCTNRIEADMEVRFETADGLFAERWETVLSAEPSDPFGEGGTGGDGTPTLQLYHSVDFDAHQGTLRPEDFAFTGAVFTGLVVTARFEGPGLDVEPASAAGGLMMEVRSSEEEGEGWVGAGNVASWSATAP
jgi:hypothetical protein